MAEKKKQVDITNPFEEQLQQKVKETFAPDPNIQPAPPAKLKDTLPGQFIIGIKNILNLPGVAIQSGLRGLTSMFGFGDYAQAISRPYKFTNENIINGMQAFSAPYRRFIAEPMVTRIAVAQDVFRNPGKYWLNPDALFDTYQKAYSAAQGDREGLEWYRDPKNPVTLGQALDAINRIGSKEIPSLLDTEAVYKYYVYDPDGEGPLEAPGKNRSGAIDFMAILLFDPINYIPVGGATKVSKVATATTKGAAKAGVETLDLSAKGLKQLTPENFRTISDAAYASGREDVGDFLLLLDETASEGRDSLVNSFVFFGSPEFSQTASILKSSFYDYDILAKNLPGQNIPEVPSFSGLTDVKYFANNGDAFAATDDTILQWIHPYTNSKGQLVEGYWREAALFPRSILAKAQTAIADDAFDLNAGISKTIQDAESKIEFDYTTPEFPATIDTGYMFQYSLAGARNDLDLPSNLSPDMRVPVNSLELPIYDGVKIDRSGLRSKDVNFASVFVGGKRIVLASRFKNGKQEIFKLESIRKTYKPKELESEDVLARTQELDESINSVDVKNLQKKTDKIVKKVLALKNLIDDTTDIQKLFESELTKSELKIYKDTINDRFLAGLVTERELGILNKFGSSEDFPSFFSDPNFRVYQNIDQWPVKPGAVRERNTVTPKEDYSIETIQGIDDEIADEFFKLLSGESNDIPMGLFDEFDEAGGISAFADDIKSLTDTGSVTPSLTRATTVLSREKELVWVPQSRFDFRSVEGYETIFYSPIDGSPIATVVPKGFKIFKPASAVFDGEVNLPELLLTKSPSNIGRVFSFDIAGQIVPIQEAKASFARLKENIIRRQLELEEAQRNVVKRAIKLVMIGDVGLKAQYDKVEEAINELFPKIKANAKEINRLKKVRSKNQSQLSGSVGFSGMTDQEIALLRLSDQYDRLDARRESLAIAINVANEVPKTPKEIGFYFKVVDGENGPEISLVRRTLDWDSFGGSDGIRTLLTPPSDEVIGVWKLTEAELNRVNFMSSKNGGYATTWDLFHSFNAGDEGVYMVNAAEVENWATKKSFRIRDYRSTINKLRRDSGLEPYPYDPDIDNSMNYADLLKEQARIEWMNANKARVWAQQQINKPNISPKQKASAEKLLSDMTIKLKSIEEGIAKDTDLITRVIGEGYSGQELTPRLWQAIYGQIPKPEVWLNGFLKALNEFGGTSVSLTDNAISKLDIVDSPYPVATVDEWGELPMGTPDPAIPEEVLNNPNTPTTAPLFDIDIDSLPGKSIPVKEETVDISDVTIPVYEIGTTGEKYVFQGFGQNFSELAKSGTKIIPTTPIGILEEVLRLNPGNKKVQKLLNNFKSKEFGPEENEFLDAIIASVSIDKNGQKLSYEDPSGFANLIAALSGDKQAIEIADSKLSSFYKIIKETDDLENSQRLTRIQKWAEEYGQSLPKEVDETQIPVIRSLQFPATRNADGSIDLFPAGYYEIGTERSVPRASLHFTLEGTVSSHLFGQWDKSQSKIVTNLSSIIKDNGLPYSLAGYDTWWMKSPGEPVKLTNAIIVTPFTDVKNYASELTKRGYYNNGKNLPLIFVDSETKEIIHIIKKDYSSIDRLQIFETADELDLTVFVTPNGKTINLKGDPESFVGHESEIIETFALQTAKYKLGIESPPTRVSSNSIESKAAQDRIDALLVKYNLRSGMHQGTPPEMLEKIQVGDSYSKLFGPIEGMRFAALLGRFSIGKPKPKYNTGI